MQASEAVKKMRESMMLQHKSRKTIKTYLAWAEKFMAYLHAVPAGRSREDNVIAFLTRLAVNEHVAASTQKQALCAVVYLYKRALRIELGDLSDFTRATKYQYIPAVLGARSVTRPPIPRDSGNVISMVKPEEIDKINKIAALIKWRVENGLALFLEKRMGIKGGKVKTSGEAYLAIEGLKKMFQNQMKAAHGEAWWLMKFDNPAITEYIAIHKPAEWR